MSVLLRQPHGFEGFRCLDPSRPTPVGSARGSPLGRESVGQGGTGWFCNGSDSLLLGLGLSVALVLAVALPATASAASTLTGETLSGEGSGDSRLGCRVGEYSVSGTATGPYPGTFEESASWNSFTGVFNATFTITSGTTTITGSKSLVDNLENLILCGAPVATFVLTPSYTATIHTPVGNFHDEGISTVSARFEAPIFPARLTSETFASSLTEPVLIAPTSKDQCKNNGWKAFPQFKNQGQCVSSWTPTPNLIDVNRSALRRQRAPTFSCVARSRCRVALSMRSMRSRRGWTRRSYFRRRVGV